MTPAMVSETTTLDLALAERERVLRILHKEAPRLRALRDDAGSFPALLRGLPHLRVSLPQVLGAAALLAAAVIIVWRTASIRDGLALELAVRDLLRDLLVVRPRFKEVLLGWPGVVILSVLRPPRRSWRRISPRYARSSGTCSKTIVETTASSDASAIAGTESADATTVSIQGKRASTRASATCSFPIRAWPRAIPCRRIRRWFCRVDSMRRSTRGR